MEAAFTKELLEGLDESGDFKIEISPLKTIDENLKANGVDPDEFANMYFAFRAQVLMSKLQPSMVGAKTGGVDPPTKGYLKSKKFVLGLLTMVGSVAAGVAGGVVLYQSFQNKQDCKISNMMDADQNQLTLCQIALGDFSNLTNTAILAGGGILSGCASAAAALMSGIGDIDIANQEAKVAFRDAEDVRRKFIVAAKQAARGAADASGLTPELKRDAIDDAEEEATDEADRIFLAAAEKIKLQLVKNNPDIDYREILGDTTRALTEAGAGLGRNIIANVEAQTRVMVAQQQNAAVNRQAAEQVVLAAFGGVVAGGPAAAAAAAASRAVQLGPALLGQKAQIAAEQAQGIAAAFGQQTPNIPVLPQAPPAPAPAPGAFGFGAPAAAPAAAAAPAPAAPAAAAAPAPAAAAPAAGPAAPAFSFGFGAPAAEPAAAPAAAAPLAFGFGAPAAEPAAEAPAGRPRRGRGGGMEGGVEPESDNNAILIAMLASGLDPHIAQKFFELIPKQKAAGSTLNRTYRKSTKRLKKTTRNKYKK